MKRRRAAGRTGASRDKAGLRKPLLAPWSGRSRRDHSCKVSIQNHQSGRDPTPRRVMCGILTMVELEMESFHFLIP
jgi:hypothetical protein